MSYRSQNFCNFGSTTNNFKISYALGNFSNQPASKVEEKKPNNVALPNRRRSRLGTYRASLINQELVNVNKTNSEKKVQSQKKSALVLPSSTPGSCKYQNNGVKKRLFIHSPTSRRLNMDTSSIIQTSAENHDPDVTGVCFFGDSTQCVEKSQVETNKKKNVNQQSRKYLSSLENYNAPLLRSVKKASTPSRLVLLSKSPFLSSSKMSSCKKSDTCTQFSRFNKKSVQTPTSPSPKRHFLRSQALKVIQTPESPHCTAGVLAAIQKRQSTIELNNHESSIHNFEKKYDLKPQVHDGFPESCVSKLEKNSPIRESVCSRLFDNEPTSFVTRKHSVDNYDHDNSLEAAYASVNGTYDIIETSTKNVGSNNSVCEKAGNYAGGVVNGNIINEIVKECNDSVVEKQSTLHDRSPSFITFVEKVNVTYELDTTETFVYNESLINDETLKCTDLENKESTLKKKKLSVITEETVVDKQPLISSSYFSNSSLMKKNQSFNTTMQITTFDTDFKNKENRLNCDVNNLLLKFCDTVKHIEKSNKEKELFIKRHNDAMDDLNKCLLRLNVEKDRYLREQEIHNTNLLDSLNDFKSEIKVFIESNQNNKDNLSNSRMVIEALKDADKMIDSAKVSVGVMKTPENLRRTQSKSVYNQLKTEYSCLKTPKASTIKKNMASTSRKILTPHSMSLCVQDQVDQLFDEQD